MRDFTQGVLEGLAYSLALMKREKRSNISAKISHQILTILEAQAEEFEFRIRATA